MRQRILRSEWHAAKKLICLPQQNHMRPGCSPAKHCHMQIEVSSTRSPTRELRRMASCEIGAVVEATLRPLVYRLHLVVVRMDVMGWYLLQCPSLLGSWDPTSARRGGIQRHFMSNLEANIAARFACASTDALSLQRGFPVGGELDCAFRFSFHMITQRGEWLLDE